MIITVNCPYCGTKRTMQIDSSDTWQNLIPTCDTEDGGCDQPYAVMVRIKADVEVRGVKGFSVVPPISFEEGFSPESEEEMYTEAESFYLHDEDD